MDKRTYLSAIIGQWRWILEGRELNVAWVRGIGTNPIGIFLTMVALIGTLLASTIMLVRNLKPGHYYLRMTRVQSLLQLIALGLIPIMILSAYKYDPYYHYGQKNIESVKETIIAEIKPQDVIVLDPYLSGIWQYFLNFNFVDSVIYSLDLSMTDQVDPQIRGVWDWKRRNLFFKLPIDFERVWIISETIR